MQQQYAIRNPGQFEAYGENCWGITASEGPGWVTRYIKGKERHFFGYLARGVPDGPDDGTIAPWAVVASLPFAPEIVLPALQYFDDLNLRVANTYGYKATFNPTFPRESADGPGWVSPWHLGLNQGPIVLMIENYRSGLLWRLMRQCPYLVRGLRRAGFSGGWLEGARFADHIIDTASSGAFTDGRRRLHIRERWVIRVLSHVGLLAVDCLRRWPDSCIWPEDSRGPERECRSRERPNRRAETCSGPGPCQTADFHRDEPVSNPGETCAAEDQSRAGRAAQAFAEYLANTDKFSHTADGKEPWDRTTKAGYQHCIILENIAYEYNSAGFTAEALAGDFVRGWENSPGHRKNMLDPDVQDIGVGLARSSRTGRYYAVQDFGRPKSAMITFKVSNRTDTPVTYTIDGQTFTASPGYTITYERSRPPELRFPWGEKANVTQAARKVFRPASGASYTIRTTEGNTVTVDSQ